MSVFQDLVHIRPADFLLLLDHDQVRSFAHSLFHASVGSH